MIRLVTAAGNMRRSWQAMLADSLTSRYYWVVCKSWSQCGISVHLLRLGISDLIKAIRYQPEGSSRNPEVKTAHGRLFSDTPKVSLWCANIPCLRRMEKTFRSQMPYSRRSKTLHLILLSLVGRMQRRRENLAWISRMAFSNSPQGKL